MTWQVFTDIAPKPDGGYRVALHAIGDTAEETQQGAEYVMHQIVGGKRCLIRTRPKVSTEVDYDTREERHCCTARFFYFEEPGEWEDLKLDPAFEESSVVTSFGIGAADG